MPRASSGAKRGPMRADADTAAWLRLGLLPELSPRAFRVLLKAFGLPGEILSAGPALSKVVPDEVARAIVRGPAPAVLDRALSWLEADACHALVTLADD